MVMNKGERIIESKAKILGYWVIDIESDIFLLQDIETGRNVDKKYTLEELTEFLNKKGKNNEFYQLFACYVGWRLLSEEMLNHMSGSLDCGESKVRQDFSEYAGLKKEISFDEMYELEGLWEG